ncbi:hypothetical protein MCEMRE26_00127 [Candidatus Nanopelagicaceae bacterium]
MINKNVSVRIFLSSLLIAISLTVPMHSAQAENCGWAMVNADGVSGAVLVGDCGGSFLAEWNALGLTEGVFKSYGCKLPCTFVIQTRQSETGNVAGYSSSFDQPSDQSRVTYDATTNSFTVANGPTSSPSISLIIKDGIATDSTGRSFNTGTGLSATTTLTAEQFNSFVRETTRIESAKSQQSIAKAKSVELALQTPGIERCVTWQGFLENGKECSMAISFDSSTVTSVSETNSLVSESTTVLSIPDSATSLSESVTVRVKGDNEFKVASLEINAVQFSGKTSEIVSLVTKLETERPVSQDISRNFEKLNQLRSRTYSSEIKLPNSKFSDETIIVSTPKVCRAEGISIVRIAKGSCEISYSLLSKSGNEYTSNKSWMFK